MLSCKPLLLLAEEEALPPSVLSNFRRDDLLASRNAGIDISITYFKAMMGVRMPKSTAKYHYDGDLLHGMGGTGSSSWNAFRDE